MFRATIWLAACLLLTGCATRFENFPLASGRANEERRAVDVSHEERPLILVAISGGGSRAAALGWVVLRELGKFRYSTRGPSRSLIDDIGVVSSVSGGSVIAAHFALYGADGIGPLRAGLPRAGQHAHARARRGQPDHLVSAGDHRDLHGSTSSRSCSTSSCSRTRHSTISISRGKPYLILNATDMASGEVFAFTPEAIRRHLLGPRQRADLRRRGRLIRRPDRASRRSPFRITPPSTARTGRRRNGSRPGSTAATPPTSISSSSSLRGTQMICGMARTAFEGSTICIFWTAGWRTTSPFTVCWRPSRRPTRRPSSPARIRG